MADVNLITTQVGLNGHDIVIGGTGTNNSSSYSIIIGNGAQSSSPDNVVIGRYADASASRNVVIGSIAEAGSGSVAIGSSAEARSYDVVIGYEAKANLASDAVIIGSSAAGSSLSMGAVAIGYNAKVNSPRSVAIGCGAGHFVQLEGGSSADAVFDNSVDINAGNNRIFIGFVPGQSTWGSTGAYAVFMVDGTEVVLTAAEFIALLNSAKSLPTS